MDSLALQLIAAERAALKRHLNTHALLQQVLDGLDKHNALLEALIESHPDRPALDAALRRLLQAAQPRNPQSTGSLPPASGESAG